MNSKNELIPPFPLGLIPCLSNVLRGAEVGEFESHGIASDADLDDDAAAICLALHRS
jgi:hypothetical protein